MIARSRIGLPYLLSPICRYGVSGDVRNTVAFRVDQIERRVLALDLAAEDQGRAQIHRACRTASCCAGSFCERTGYRTDVLGGVIHVTDRAQIDRGVGVVEIAPDRRKHRLRRRQVAGRHHDENAVSRKLEDMQLVVGTDVVDTRAGTGIACENQSLIHLDGDAISHSYSAFLGYRPLVATLTEPLADVSPARSLRNLRRRCRRSPSCITCAAENQRARLADKARGCLRHDALSNIEFYWDAVRPYTYLAATQIEALAQKHGATLVWKPMLLGRCSKPGQPPADHGPGEGQYMFRDLTLWSRYCGVPLTMPSVFPTNSITAMRIACGLPAQDCGRWAQAVMQAYWGLGQDIGKPELLQGIATALGPRSPIDARTGAGAGGRATSLELNTEEAVRRGAFGAPAFFYLIDTLFSGATTAWI